MRIVVKVGTSLLTDKHYQLDRVFIRNLVKQIAEMERAGHKVILVSSGAVASGRQELSIKHEKKNIPFRQALAAVGQGLLIETYRKFFKKYRISVAQALLTSLDFTRRENFLNTKHVFELLLEKGVVPIVNENDVTTIEALTFGGNDMLSAYVAAMVSADYLVIFTDVDGLLSKGKVVPVVEKIDDSVKALAGGARSRHSIGGMTAKLEAAKYAVSSCVSMFIVNGRRKNILKKVVESCETRGTLLSNYSFLPAKNPGTFFPSSVSCIDSQKKWMKPQIKKNTWIEIDAGAAKALKKSGKSLLSSGIAKIHGEFNRGDVVAVKGQYGEVAYGQINYGSSDLDKIKHCRSDEIEDILGFSFEPEAMHRDRMVIL
ncbi:glutamate 5-kinase [Candidatus Peregrinibacteria bacterium]|nr:glutamate 5-kinase [Candidatus Peregrinibacteria bacterium]